MLERAADLPLPDVVARAVTDPLGMRASGFTPKEPERLATPYAAGKDEPVRMTDGIYVPFAGADFHVFLEALRTRHPFVSGAIWSRNIASIEREAARRPSSATAGATDTALRFFAIRSARRCR